MRAFVTGSTGLLGNNLVRTLLQAGHEVWALARSKEKARRELGEIYRSAGYGTNDIFLNIVITGAINLVFTVLSMLLVDRLGRRWMMLFGCIGISVFHLVCALAYRSAWPPAAVLTLTLGAIPCYALTVAPVTWVLIAEIFPNRVRSHGVSAAVSSLWTASFLLTYTFPAMNAALGTSGIFFTYSAICFAGCLLVARFVPETKGKTLEEIEAVVAASGGPRI